MGEPVELGRACALCGDQVIMRVQSNWSHYNDDLSTLLEAAPDEPLMIEAHCGCDRPRRVVVEAQVRRTLD